MIEFRLGEAYIRYEQEKYNEVRELIELVWRQTNTIKKEKA